MVQGTRVQVQEPGTPASGRSTPASGISRASTPGTVTLLLVLFLCMCPCPESGPRQPDEIDMVTPANHLDFSAILPLFPSLEKLVLCFQTKRCAEVLLMTARH